MLAPRLSAMLSVVAVATYPCTAIELYGVHRPALCRLVLRSAWLLSIHVCTLLLCINLLYMLIKRALFVKKLALSARKCIYATNKVQECLFSACEKL